MEACSLVPPRKKLRRKWSGPMSFFLIHDWILTGPVLCRQTIPAVSPWVQWLCHAQKAVIALLPITQLEHSDWVSQEKFCFAYSFENRWIWAVCAQLLMKAWAWEVQVSRHLWRQILRITSFRTTLARWLTQPWERESSPTPKMEAIYSWGCHLHRSNPIHSPHEDWQGTRPQREV